MSGLSVFFLDEEADSGDMLFQLPLEIDPRETSSNLFRRFVELHELAGHRLGLALVSGRVEATKQDERLACWWPKRGRKDSEIDFSLPAASVDSLVRAQARPYPAAYVECRSGVLEIHEVALTEQSGPPRFLPGTVTTAAGGRDFRVACTDCAVEVREWMWNGCQEPLWRPGVALRDH